MDAAWEGSAFAESGLAGAGEVKGMWTGGAGGAGTTLLPFSPPFPPAGTIARGLSAATLRA